MGKPKSLIDGEIVVIAPSASVCFRLAPFPCAVAQLLGIE